jgi:hypothetical protein
LVVTAMTRTSFAMSCGLLLVPPACGKDYQRPAASVDCTVADAYDFKPFALFEGGDPGWYLYTDLTPGGVPNPDAGSNVQVTQLNPPRCGSTGAIELLAYGNNYWGAGFADWQHNAKSGEASGDGYQGISFWARSPGNTDKTFLLRVDDDRTLNNPPTVTKPNPDAGPCDDPCVCIKNLPRIQGGDQDLDGDGCLGPGDIAADSRCQLPPAQKIGDPACYYGGVQAPDAVTRVPQPGECGNSFHTYVTTTEDWQLYLLPWSRLVQWPCPNRLAGGIDPAHIRKIEVRLEQGTHYDIWLDDIQFYRLRTDAGS